MASFARATSALERAAVEFARWKNLVRSLISSSISSVSRRSSSSPARTFVPLSITHVIVLLPRTRHLISVLLALSSVPCSVTATTRLPRATRCTGS